MAIKHHPRQDRDARGLRNFVASMPDTLHIEHGAMVAESDLVMVHTRYTGSSFSDQPLLAVDIFRFEYGLLVEHWDVVQEAVPADVMKIAYLSTWPTLSERPTATPSRAPATAAPASKGLPRCWPRCLRRPRHR
jgi:hypothetical protein